MWQVSKIHLPLPEYIQPLINHSVRYFCGKRQYLTKVSNCHQLCHQTNKIQTTKNPGSLDFTGFPGFKFERETGIGPATFALARRRSTTLLLAQLKFFNYRNFFNSLEKKKKRETGIGPATFALARRRSTTLLLAQF